MNRSIEPTDPSDLGLASQVLGGLPIINAVADRLGLSALLAAALPDGDARVKVSSAAAIRLVVTNLVLGREPTSSTTTPRRSVHGVYRDAAGTARAVSRPR